MAKKKVLITIDEGLNDRLDALAKKVRRSKSGIVEDMLLELLPIIEHQNPRDMIAEALKLAGKGLQDVGSLLDEKKKV